MIFGGKNPKNIYIQKHTYFFTDFLILLVLCWLVVIFRFSVKISILQRKNDVFFDVGSLCGCHLYVVVLAFASLDFYLKKK